MSICAVTELLDWKHKIFQNNEKQFDETEGKSWNENGRHEQKTEGKNDTKTEGFVEITEGAFRLICRKNGRKKKLICRENGRSLSSYL